MVDDLKVQEKPAAVFWLEDVVAAWVDRDDMCAGDRKALSADVARAKDAILALIRERDEARAANHILSEQAHDNAVLLLSAQERAERYKAGITQVAAHIANAGRGEETTNERILDRIDEVLAALTKEPHHG